MNFRLPITIGVVTLVAMILPRIGHTDENPQESYIQPPISDNRALEIGSPALSGSEVLRYGMLEMTFPLQGTYSNAFDPDEINVWAIITTPDGKILEQPAFYYQEYTRSLESNVEVLKRSGEPVWKIRFSPVTIGKYTIMVKAKDRTGASASTKTFEFECVKSNLHGFVRQSKKDKRYFAFDDGTCYFPTGANICWASWNMATYDYDEWFPKYSDAGCNYFRVWAAPGWVTLALETNGTPSDRYGAGKINLSNAWRMDYVLDQANRRGFYIMMCLESFNTLRKNEDSSYPYWEDSPLNHANGGPLLNPIDYWTNPEMLRIYKNKLRYIIARYGWSPNILSWEFWNEVDIVSPSAFKADLVTSWHAQMGDYIHGIDNWHHLRTTSFAQWPGVDGILALPEIDYTQTHDYGIYDFSAVIADQQKQREKYGKPHYIGEFGADAWSGDPEIDPKGIAFHTGIWSSVMSGGSGSAMSWYWDTHIEVNNLYPHLAALNAFIKGIQFDKERFRRIEGASFAYENKRKQPIYRDIIIQGPASWEPSPANRPTTLTITRDGKIRNISNVSGVLHGKINHSNEHNPLTIQMDLPHPTKIKISVQGVSGYGGAHLIVSLDGKTIIDKDMPNNDPANVQTMQQYNGIYEIDVPEGKHTVVVENIGTDWIYVNYIIEKALPQTSPTLRAYGLRGKNTSIVWVENQDHTWYKVNVLKHDAEEEKDTILTIPNWENGIYEVRFWDTYLGREISKRTVEVEDGIFSVELPTIAKDVALRINPIDW